MLGYAISFTVTRPLRCSRRLPSWQAAGLAMTTSMPVAPAGAGYRRLPDTLGAGACRAAGWPRAPAVSQSGM